MSSHFVDDDYDVIKRSIIKTTDSSAKKPIFRKKNSYTPLEDKSGNVRVKKQINPEGDYACLRLNNESESCKEENKSKDSNNGTASIISCVINLSNTVIGAGMLGLPNAFAESGFIGGCVFLFVSAFFSGIGLHLLAKSAITIGFHENEMSSFYTVANAALPQFTILIDFAVALKCFGVATGYFITVGDCMVDAFKYILPKEFLTSRYFWILLGLFLVLPISFFKTLNALRCASSLSLFIIYGLVVMVILYAQGIFDPCFDYNNNVNITLIESSASESNNYLLTSDADLADSTDDSNEACRGETILISNFMKMIRNLAVFIFSFTCHQNIFSVVNEISNRSQARIDIVIVISVTTALILYLIVSVEGYRTYGSEVKSDIILNYPQTLPVSLMRIAIAFMVILSYPLQLDPSRRCITSLVHSCRSWLEQIQRRRQHQIEEEINKEILENGNVLGEIVNDLYPDDLDTTGCENDFIKSRRTEGENENVMEERKMLEEFRKDFLFNGITCTFLVLSFSIAMSVSDLGVILSIVGATGSTTVSYILPGLIYLKLHPHMHFMKAVAYLQLTLGLLIVPSALYFVINGVSV